MATTRTRLATLFVLAVGIAGAGAAWATEKPVVITGSHTEDVFANGDEVRIQADVDAGVVVMGGDVEIRSKVSGDVIAMGGHLDVGDEIQGDVLAAGGKVKLTGKSAGEVTAMGGTIKFDAELDSDLLATGGWISLENKINGDVKAVGGKIENDAAIDGDAKFAGGRVDLDKSSNITGNAWIVGGKIEVDGVVGKDVRAAGRKVEIKGEIKGNLHIDALEIEIHPTARILGNFEYRSPNKAEIDEGASIGGDVTSIQSEDPTQAVGFAFAAAGGVVLVVFLALVLLGAMQMLMFPEMTIAASRRGLKEPLKSLGIGFAVLVATPVAIGLLMSTLIGIPIAIVLGAAYIILLALGYGVTASTIGHRTLRLIGRNWSGSAMGRVGIIAVGLVVIGIVTLIPFLGILAVFLACCLGIGAMAAQKFAAGRRARDMEGQLT